MLFSHTQTDLATLLFGNTMWFMPYAQSWSTLEHSNPSQVNMIDQGTGTERQTLSNPFLRIWKTPYADQHKP